MGKIFFFGATRASTRHSIGVIIIAIDETQHDLATVCRACGACCSYSAEWPRCSVETDAQIQRIPPEFVDDEQGRMRCDGNRCAALRGDVGISTSCAAYDERPAVCRACLPG